MSSSVKSGGSAWININSPEYRHRFYLDWTTKKFVPYEADSITPFVANSPFMSFFYEHPEEYRQHLTHEGELKPEERAWQTANNTYAFSDGLGVGGIDYRGAGTG
ncbi:DUF417 family protein [Salmonella enterica subsp. enterica serovar Enteritidis]|nr:DUF417 family protein [Salmonella enterica subsp. enterica serovar Enteritidis]